MAAEEIVVLRNESMAAQQQRLDLAKFKIVCIAVLGSLAIGASGLTTGSVPYIIGIIPFVSIYIDVISETKKIQFMAIGAFLNTLTRESVIGRYEDFVEKNREGFLRNYSYQLSTLVVCAAIAALGIGRLIFSAFITSYAPDPLLVAIEIVSGVTGIVGAMILNRVVKKKIESFKTAVENES